MALPKAKKKILSDQAIESAIQRAAEVPSAHGTAPARPRGGRPSPRAGKIVRQTLLLHEETAERLTMAYASEQIKRKKLGGKLDKSLFIEEMILRWLDDQGY